MTIYTLTLPTDLPDEAYFFTQYNSVYFRSAFKTRNETEALKQ